MSSLKSYGFRPFYGCALILLMLVGCSTVPENTADLCAIFEERDSWYDHAKDAEKRWGTKIPVSMAFVKVES